MCYYVLRLRRIGIRLSIGSTTLVYKSYWHFKKRINAMERRIPIRRHRLCGRVHDRASWRPRHDGARAPRTRHNPVIVALSRHRGGGATKARSERGGNGGYVARLIQGCYKMNTAETILGVGVFGFRKGDKPALLPRRISDQINYHRPQFFIVSK